jgi:hypothetical protein
MVYNVLQIVSTRSRALQLYAWISMEMRDRDYDERGGMMKSFEEIVIRRITSPATRDEIMLQRSAMRCQELSRKIRIMSFTYYTQLGQYD